MKRPIPLALTALVAFFSALAALAVSGGHDAHAHGLAVTDHPRHHQHAIVRSRGTITVKELRLRNDMRKLWEDHITWTRLAIISLVDGSPDTNATVARLLRNQQDIGDAIKPYYGDQAGDALARKLREHILIAADLIAAAKSGDQERVAAEQARWRQNAREIAAFLSHANPRFWKREAITSMMFMHLQLTTDEVVARLHGDWNADVAAYDQVHRHILGMADVLSTGIVKQFPRQFR
jgi:hypothetical protein